MKRLLIGQADTLQDQDKAPYSSIKKMWGYLAEKTETVFP